MWYTKSEVSTASDQKSEALLKNINCTTSSSKQLVSLLLRCQRASHCPGSKVSFSPRDRDSLGIEADLKAWSFKLCDYKKYTQKWSGRSAAGQQRRLNYFTSVRSRLTSDTNNNNNNTELHRHVMMCLWGPKKTQRSLSYIPKDMCLCTSKNSKMHATRWCCFRRQIAARLAGDSPEILGTHEERLLAAHRVGHLGLALTRPLLRRLGRSTPESQESPFSQHKDLKTSGVPFSNTSITWIM